MCVFSHSLIVANKVSTLKGYEPPVGGPDDAIAEIRGADEPHPASHTANTGHGRRDTTAMTEQEDKSPPDILRRGA